MKYIILTTILLLSVYLGFVLGETKILKQQVVKQNICSDYALTDTNLNKFYQEDLSKNIESIYIHAYAAVALKYVLCMQGKE
jgi:hypothetical protein